MEPKNAQENTARQRCTALAIAIAFSLFSTWCAFRLGANFGSTAYFELARNLGEDLSDSGCYILYLWFLVPAIFIASRIGIQLRATGPTSRLSDAIQALLIGYVIGICFTILSQVIYYSYLLAFVHTGEEFAIAPSVLGILSDWQALSGALIGIVLFFTLLPLFRKSQADGGEHDF